MALSKVPKYLANLLLLLALIVSIYAANNTVYFTFANHVPIPQWDEWQIYNEYIDWVSGITSRFEYLWTPHNEHRTVIAKLLFHLDIDYFEGRFIFPKIVPVIVHFLHMIVFILFALIYSRNNTHDRLAAVAAIIVLFFSGYHLENFYRAFNSQVITEITFVTFSLSSLILFRQSFENLYKARIYFLVTLLFAILATLSYGAGILVWPVLVTVSVLIRAPRRYIFFLASITILVSLLYVFRHESIGETNPLHVVKSPLSVTVYFFAYLGSPFAGQQLSVAIPFGIFGVAAFVFFGKRIIARYYDKRETICFLSTLLFCIGLAVILSAAITAIGRYELTPRQALSGRYASIASVYWACLLIECLSSNSLSRVKYRWLGSGIFKRFRVVFILAGIAIIVHTNSYWHRVFKIEYEKFTELSLALISGAPDTGTQATPNILAYAYKRLDYIDKVVGFMKAHRLSLYAKGLDSILITLKEELANKDLRSRFLLKEDWCAGEFNSLGLIFKKTPDGRDWARLHGWAWDKKEQGRPKAILFGDKQNHFIGYGKVFQRRDRALERNPWLGTPHVGWFGYVAANLGEAIRAYALSADFRSICPLQGMIYVR